MFNFFKSEPKTYVNLSAEDFRKEMSASDAIIIDVRSAGEFQSGKIKGARNLDVTAPGFSSQIQNLPKDKKYFLYCRSGARSSNACSIMSKQGFEKVYNLSSGIMGWPFGLN
jgi:rhodanese-related sulfurtransferase